MKNKNLRKLIFIGIFTLLIITLGLVAFVMSSSDEVFFESEESKTAYGASVFNKIKYFNFKDKEVWMMNQSHYGSRLSPQMWDRLAIVIDKNKKPKSAEYLQLKPGALIWNDNLFLEQIPLKAQCNNCHTNGPRAIRPNWNSPLNPSGFMQKIQVLAWNFKIKTSGRILSTTHFNRSPEKEKSMDILNIKTCNHCHKEDGLFARGPLTVQNIGTIMSMVNRGIMPPLGFNLDEKEKLELEKFIF